MRSIMNKKGQIINIATGTFVAVLLMGFTVFAILYAIVILNPTSFFTAGSAAYNNTGYMMGNITEAPVGLFAKLPTVGLVLGGVLAIAAVFILIGYIMKLRVGGSSL